MSGTIIPGETLVSQPVNRQTIPYGDRPIGEVRNGRVYATRDHYQWMVRVGAALNSEIENVGTVIDNVNSIDVNLGSIEAEIGTLFADVTQLAEEIAHIAVVPPPAPPIPAGPTLYPPPLAPAVLPAPAPPAPLAPAPGPSTPLNLIGSPQPLAPPALQQLQPPPLPPPPSLQLQPPPLAAPLAPAIPAAGWQLINKYVESGASAFTLLLPTTFSRFKLAMQGVTVGTSAAFIEGQWSVNGGSSFITSGYAQFGSYNSATTPTSFDQTGTSVLMSLGLSNASTAALDGEFNIYPGTAAIVAIMQGDIAFFQSTSSWVRGMFAGAVAVSAVANAMQVFVNTGTFGGSFWLWGLQ